MTEEGKVKFADSSAEFAAGRGERNASPAQNRLQVFPTNPIMRGESKVAAAALLAPRLPTASLTPPA